MSLHPKVAASGISSSIAVLVIYCLHRYAHTDLPAEVGAAVTAIVGSLFGWLTPPPEHEDAYFAAYQGSVDAQAVAVAPSPAPVTPPLAAGE